MGRRLRPTLATDFRVTEPSRSCKITSHKMPWVTMEISDPESKSTWGSGMLLLLNTGGASPLPADAPNLERRRKGIALAIMLACAATLAFAFTVGRNQLTPLGMAASVALLVTGRELLPSTGDDRHRGPSRMSIKQWLADNEEHILVLNTAEVYTIGHGTHELWHKESPGVSLARSLQRALPSLPLTDETHSLLDAAISAVTHKIELAPLTSLGESACESSSRDPGILAAAAAHRALAEQHAEAAAEAEEMALRVQIIADAGHKNQSEPKPTREQHES